MEPSTVRRRRPWSPEQLEGGDHEAQNSKDMTNEPKTVKGRRIWSPKQ